MSESQSDEVKRLKEHLVVNNRKLKILEEETQGYRFHSGPLPAWAFLIALVLSAILVFVIPSPEHKQDAKNISKDEYSIEAIKAEVDGLKKSLKQISAQDGDIAINARLKTIEGQVDSLSSTILVDADKAVTSRLLREKQLNLERKLDDIEASNQSLRQDVTNLVMLVFAVPFIGVVTTLIISYLRRSKIDKELREAEHGLHAASVKAYQHEVCPSNFNGPRG
jgi:hypothetical protein